MPHRLFSDKSDDFWRFYMPTQLFHCLSSEKLVNYLDRYIDNHKPQSILVLTDEGVAATDFFRTLVAQLPPHTIRYMGVESALLPMTLAVQHCREHSTDLIIGIGGGSVMDSAKIVAASAGTDIPISELKSFHHLPSPPTQLICVPTTFGTGSEVNMYAHVDDGINKYGLRKYWLCPTAAFVTGSPTLSLNAQQRYLTGLDSWIHAVECLNLLYERSPVTDMVLHQAIELHDTHFKSYVNTPTNESANAIALASCYAGIGLNNGRTGLIHTFGVALAKQVKVPHVISLLPFIYPVLNFYGDRMLGLDLDGIKDSKLFMLPTFHKSLKKITAKVDINKLVEDCFLDNVLFKETLKPLEHSTLLSIAQRSMKQFDCSE